MTAPECACMFGALYKLTITISIIIKCYTTDDKTSQTNDQDLQVHSQVHYACFVCVNLYNLVISITNFSLNTVTVSARHVPCLL